VFEAFTEGKEEATVIKKIGEGRQISKKRALFPSCFFGRNVLK
jgi:hypothetical protein